MRVGKGRDRLEGADYFGSGDSPSNLSKERSRIRFPATTGFLSIRTSGEENRVDVHVQRAAIYRIDQHIPCSWPCVNRQRLGTCFRKNEEKKNMHGTTGPPWTRRKFVENFTSDLDSWLDKTRSITHIHQAQHFLPPLNDLPRTELEGDGFPTGRIARVEHRPIRQKPARSHRNRHESS